jgi:ABC-type dipeptide/oligopeptide/nickel transport system permease subunit
MAIPFVVVAIGVSASFAPSAINVVAVLGVTGWATYARVSRLAAQPVRRATFVDAARVLGASNTRIVFHHVLPVIAPPLLAIAGQQAGAMMLYEAALSYLGRDDRRCAGDGAYGMVGHDRTRCDDRAGGYWVQRNRRRDFPAPDR